MKNKGLVSFTITIISGGASIGLGIFAMLHL